MVRGLPYCVKMTPKPSPKASDCKTKGLVKSNTTKASVMDMVCLKSKKECSTIIGK